MGRAHVTPGQLAVAGALTIAFSAILVRLAEVEPSTAAVFRCAYAVPVLALIAWTSAAASGRAPRAKGASRRGRASCSRPT